MLGVYSKLFTRILQTLKAIPWIFPTISSKRAIFEVLVSPACATMCEINRELPNSFSRYKRVHATPPSLVLALLMDLSHKNWCLFHKSNSIFLHFEKKTRGWSVSRAVISGSLNGFGWNFESRGLKDYTF